MPESHQAVRQVMLAMKISSSETCSRVFDASWISESFLWNSRFLRIAPLAVCWAIVVKPRCLATSNRSWLRSRLSCLITTCCSLSSHCSLMSFVSSVCRLSVVSGTVESLSLSHLFCVFFDFLPPFLAEFVLALFPVWWAGIWHPQWLHFSLGRSACGAVGGCCLGRLGNHPFASLSLMCTRHSSS